MVNVASWWIPLMILPTSWWMLATSFFMGYFGACVNFIMVYWFVSREATKGKALVESRRK